MEIKKILIDDMKKAMKAKDKLKLNTIRFLRAKIQEEEIHSKKDLNNNEVIKVLQKQVKQREDSAEQYKKGGRSDLFEKEISEMEIIKTYLPIEMNDNELEKICKKIIEENDFSSKKDMGKAMKLTLEKVEGKASAKRISSIIAKNLN